MFDGVTLPFTAAELLTGAFEFLKLLAPIVILGLAIAFTPKILRVIRGAAGANGKS